MLKIDVECAEWAALETCLDAGDECIGRFGQIALEVHNCPDSLAAAMDPKVGSRGGASSGGSAALAVSARAMKRRASVLRRLREEAGFVVVAHHTNPLAYFVDVGADDRAQGIEAKGGGGGTRGGWSRKSGVRKERCCGEILLARS